jgi:hypothetical protein
MHRVARIAVLAALVGACGSAPPPPSPSPDDAFVRDVATVRADLGRYLDGATSMPGAERFALATHLDRSVASLASAAVSPSLHACRTGLSAVGRIAPDRPPVGTVRTSMEMPARTLEVALRSCP